MPGKAKDVIENEEILKKVEKKNTKKSTSTAKKSTSSSTKTNSKKVNSKKLNAKQSSSNKSNLSNKASTKKSTKIENNTVSSSKKSSKKSNSKIASNKKLVATPVTEYYDLPYHYDQTVVKILAQTPKTLFVYWDVSAEDKESFEKRFGSNFFDNTIPFLRIKNNNNNHFFDVEVDDFANGWYVPVEDSKCNYLVELLRKQRPYSEKVIEEPVYVTSSNIIETPNDHILFDTNYSFVNFKNVKTNEVTSKNMASIVSLKKIGKIYNIYDFYKKIYKNEDVNEMFNLTNPSSGNPTSTLK